MAPDSNEGWLFLLTLAALPLACTEEVPGEPTSEGTTGTTTTSMPADSTSGGSTSIVTTTDVDGTSSTGETTVVDDTSGTSSSSSSDGTTMPIDPSTSTGGEESTTTGEPQGLCEVWGEARALCYGYYGPMYYINSCYDYFMYVDVACGPAAAMVYQCQATGCFADCSDQYEALEVCNDMLQAMELGCDMIAEVPAVGTIDTQCTEFLDQVAVCTAAGYYIRLFSLYVEYNPAYAQDACVYAWFFTYPPPPLGVGDVCGGAYEELLTCLSELSCDELESGIFGDTYCTTEHDALTCRCELDA